MNLVTLTPDEHILAISWNIATAPKLYRELALNPYSPTALNTISERFPNEKIDDVIIAVILAEPEGKYDRNFRLLSGKQQEEELSKQKNVSTKIRMLLINYCKKHTAELKQLPKEYAYARLSPVVFNTVDVNEIELRYSQQQRRDLKLAIIDSLAVKKRPVRRQLIPVAFAVLSLILLFVFMPRTQTILQHQETKKQVLGIITQNETQAYPVRLIIPSINVDATIENVSVTSKGAVDVPKNTDDVGWFELGPLPGEKGSAIIVGHVDKENGTAGIFYNLSTLKQGDMIYIEKDNGTRITFTVQESRMYDPGYTADVFNRRDSAYLNLITCNGVWDSTKKSYSKRLVVFADIIH